MELMRRSILFASAVLCASAAWAQSPALPRAEEAAVIEQIRTAVRFEDDGTGRRDVYMRVKAQSEAGVQQWGQVVLGYNAATERLEIPFVRVKKPDGSIVTTSAQAVQDLTSPVQRIAPVYTDFHQKHVTVESFRPGDTLEVNFVTVTHTPLAPGQFWMEYNFNDAEIVLDEQLDIDIPAARRLTLKTLPGLDPAVKEAAGRRTYHWSHAHAKDTREAKDTKDAKAQARKRDEPERAAIRLTTFGDWKEVGTWFAGLERPARKPTPEIQEKVRALTAGRTTDLEKVQALYDFVSKNFRYVSLSLGTGRYQPRPAPEVLREAYGDCKDKHTLLASLIEAAGYQASAALINSQVKIDPDFPSPTQFDHVITRATVGTQTIWLDATPEVAPFRLLSPNLRRKQVLVADASASRLEETPPDPPMASLIALNVDGRIDPAGALSAKVHMTVRGDGELVFRTVFRVTSEADWKSIAEGIVKQSGIEGKISDLHVSDPQATGAPFTLAFTVDAPRFVKWSATKTELSMPFSGAADHPSLDADDTGPVVLGAPGDVSYTMKLELPEAAKVKTPLPVSISRDYGEFRAAYAVAGRTVTAERRVTVRQSELPESRRQDCVAFVNVIEGDSRQRLSIDAPALAAASEPVSPDLEIKELNRAGYDALRARDYERAITLLKRAVELSPKDGTAWNNLGRAYWHLRQPDAAIEAYRKQIEINPYDAYAYNNLGLVYADRGDYAEAEKSYRKQIEINPLDKFAHTNLGKLYVLQRDYVKALPELEQAATLTPDDAALQVQLGKAYLELHRKDEATTAFARAVELAPNPGTWNDVAYAMALGGLDLPRARQYAESALASTAAVSRNISVDKADAGAFALAQSLGAYWDTLGWIQFTEGNAAAAEKYVAAAWNLTQHPEVGDHLGQIYEKLGRRDAATIAYARAMAASHPSPDVKAHLARAGGAAKVDMLVAAHREDLAKSRTLPLAARLPPGRAEFLVLFAAPGRIEAVKFIEGDEAFRRIIPALQALPADGVFPDDTPAKLLRRGIAACSPAGPCTFTLLLPEDARPLK